MNRILIPALFCTVLVLAGCYSQILPEPPRNRQGMLAVAGAPNTRDLGGLSGHDGGTVKRGLLIRSGGLDMLAPEGRDFLFGRGGGRMGIATVVDFRCAVPRLEFGDGDLRVTGTSSERSRARSRMPGGVFLWDSYEDRDTGISENWMSYDLGNVLWNHNYYFGPIVDNVSDWHRDLVSIHRDQFLGFFQALLDADGPVLFHCSTGKDRTGVATALLLMALGVSEEDIVKDYMRSLDPMFEKMFPVVPFLRSQMVREMRERRPDARILYDDESSVEANEVKDRLRAEARQDVLRRVMQDIFRGYAAGNVEIVEAERDRIIAALDDPDPDDPKIEEIREAIHKAFEDAMELMLKIGEHATEAEFEAWADYFARDAGNSIKPLLSVFEHWIEVAIAEVEDEWDGIEGFLDDDRFFGNMSGKNVVERLRELYLD